jgi:hypothetical protein
MASVTSARPMPRLAPVTSTVLSAIVVLAAQFRDVLAGSAPLVWRSTESFTGASQKISDDIRRLLFPMISHAMGNLSAIRQC